MSFQLIAFYCFAAWMIFAALMVITNKHSVRAALSLVLCFAAASGVWMLLEAEFLALSLIVVYVGAVMVLFLFVVMMMDVDYAAMRQGFVRKLPIAAFISVLFFVVLYAFIQHAGFDADQYAIPEPKPAEYSNIKEIGRILYTDYVLAFEVAAVILLVAIIAAIALTFRGRRNRKSQDISKQLMASKENRLRIVKMKPVTKAETENQAGAEEGQA